MLKNLKNLGFLRSHFPTLLVPQLSEQWDHQGPMDWFVSCKNKILFKFLAAGCYLKNLVIAPKIALYDSGGEQPQSPGTRVHLCTMKTTCIRGRQSFSALEVCYENALYKINSFLTLTLTMSRFRLICDSYQSTVQCSD